MSTDADDWPLACRGGAEQFAAVYDRHVADVRRAAARFTDSPADVEDVMAVVFLTLWERRRTVRFVDQSLRPWLLVTTANVGRNAQRSRRRHAAFLRRLPPPSPPVTSTDDQRSGAAVEAARALPLAQQQVVVLCVLYGYSVGDAATALSIAEGTVKSRLHRARHHMGAAITAYQGTVDVELH